MAGYLFTFSDTDSLLRTMRSGVYSTLMKATWNQASEGTLGDYVTMRPGDSVYFFSKRMVYGIGKVVELLPGQPVLSNFAGATGTSVVGDISGDETLLGQDITSGEPLNRWVIAFEPDPYFFERGIDMDDLLSSNPSAFRSLRVFWKRSFIKLDDEEDLAFRTALIRQSVDDAGMPTEGTLSLEYSSGRRIVQRRMSNRDVSLGVKDYLATCTTADGRFGREMTLEVALLSQLASNDLATEEVFGSWDYLSHQVHASPAKAVDYMDKIDVFGYRWIPGHKPIIGKYLVAELKRDKATGDDLQQVMKYVDWVRGEYAGGNYRLIKAFLIAHDFDIDSIRGQLDTTERVSLAGIRPPKPFKWSDITLVKYRAREDGIAEFERVNLES